MFSEKDFQNLQSIEQVKALRGKDFEYFSKYFLESIGFEKVQVLPQKFGKWDLNAYKNGELFAVECKGWAKNAFGNENLPQKPIEVLDSRMRQRGVKNGIFMGNLKSYPEILEFGKRFNIEVFGIDEIKNSVKFVSSFSGQNSILFFPGSQNSFSSFAFKDKTIGQKKADQFWAFYSDKKRNALFRFSVGVFWIIFSSLFSKEDTKTGVFLAFLISLFLTFVCFCFLLFWLLSFFV